MLPVIKLCPLIIWNTITAADVKAMAASKTIAVLLPCAYYFLRETQLPPIDLLRQHNVAIALASDLNPGTSPVLSLRLILNMACTLFHLTPEEALSGITFNAAKALGLSTQYGSLEKGKAADFVAWEIQHPCELSYWLGGITPSHIIRDGKEIVLNQLTTLTTASQKSMVNV